MQILKFREQPICCLSMQFITLHIFIGCLHLLYIQNKKSTHTHANIKKTVAQISCKSVFSVCRKLSEYKIYQSLDSQSHWCWWFLFVDTIKTPKSIISCMKRTFICDCVCVRVLVLILHESRKIDDTQSITHCKTLKIKRKFNRFFGETTTSPSTAVREWNRVESINDLGDACRYCWSEMAMKAKEFSSQTKWHRASICWKVTFL